MLQKVGFGVTKNRQKIVVRMKMTTSHNRNVESLLLRTLQIVQWPFGRVHVQHSRPSDNHAFGILYHLFSPRKTTFSEFCVHLYNPRCYLMLFYDSLRFVSMWPVLYFLAACCVCLYPCGQVLTPLELLRFQKPC